MKVKELRKRNIELKIKKNETLKPHRRSGSNFEKVKSIGVFQSLVYKKVQKLSIFLNNQANIT